MHQFFRSIFQGVTIMLFLLYFMKNKQSWFSFHIKFTASRFLKTTEAVYCFISTFRSESFGFFGPKIFDRESDSKSIYVSNMLLFMIVLNHYIFVQALFFLK